MPRNSTVIVDSKRWQTDSHPAAGCSMIEGIIPLLHSPELMEKAFENIVGTGENAGNHHFLLFP